MQKSSYILHKKKSSQYFQWCHSLWVRSNTKEQFLFRFLFRSLQTLTDFTKSTYSNKATTINIKCHTVHGILLPNPHVWRRKGFHTQLWRKFLLPTLYGGGGGRSGEGGGAGTVPSFLTVLVHQGNGIPPPFPVWTDGQIKMKNIAFPHTT